MEGDTDDAAFTFTFELLEAVEGLVPVEEDMDVDVNDVWCDSWPLSTAFCKTSNH